MIKWPTSWSPAVLCAVISVSCGVNESTEQESLELQPTSAEAQTGPSHGSTAQVAMAFKTQPGSMCILHGSGADGNTSGLALFAAENGIVRFYQEAPETQVPDAANFPQLDCQAPDGTSLPTQTIDPETSARLAAADDAEQMALPIQPPLTGDLLSYSQRELLSLGQPPRPDPNNAPPEQLAKWREIVSTPKRIISPKTVLNPTVSMTHSFDNSWSGIITYQPPTLAAYDWIQATWIVPAVTVAPGVQWGTAYASLWVGLTGGALAQAGTDQIAMELSGIGYASYNAWIQFFPGPNHVTSLAVHPDDRIYTEVWVGDSYGNYDVAGGYCWAYIYNTTTGLVWQGNVPVPSGYMFTGDSAAWILERPLVGGTNAYLADFYSTPMYGTLAYSVDGEYLDINEPFSEEKWMKSTSTGNILDTIVHNPLQAGTISFYWNADH